MEISKILQNAREVLLNNGIDPREARLLLAFVMKIKKEELIKYKECSKLEYKEFEEILNRRISGEPFAYIVGYKEFMKLNFKVNSDVLVPREDTELLVEKVIELAEKKTEKKVKILDMCTGSGCIAISLAKYLNNVEVVAVDISQNALNVAKENARINNVEINFINSNLFDNVHNRFDIIVSNPPYIKTKVISELQKEVKKEPILALDGGESGLYFYENILKESNKYLSVDGIVTFEIGFDQAKDVVNLFKKYDFKDIEVKKDLSGNDRVVTGCLKDKS